MQSNRRAVVLAWILVAFVLSFCGVCHSQTANYDMGSAPAEEKQPAAGEKLAAFFECAFINPQGAETNEGYLKTVVLVEKNGALKLYSYNCTQYLSVEFEDPAIQASSWPQALDCFPIAGEYREREGVETEKFAGREYLKFTVVSKIASMPAKTGVRCETTLREGGARRTSVASKKFSFAGLKPNQNDGPGGFYSLRREYYGRAVSFMTMAFVSGDTGFWNYFLNKYVYFLARSFAVKFDSPKYVDTFMNRFRSLRRGSEFTYSFSLISGSMAVMESLQLESMKEITKSLEFFREVFSGKEDPVIIDDKIFVRDAEFRAFVDSRFFGPEDIKKQDIYLEKEVENIANREHAKYLKKLWDPMKGISSGFKNFDRKQEPSEGDQGRKKYPYAVIVDDSAKGRPAVFYTLGYYPAESAPDFERFKAKYSPAVTVRPNYVRADKLVPPLIKSHDYDKMITELGKKSTEVEIFKTAFYCPKDCSYFYFGTVGGALDIFDEAKKYARNLSSILPTSDNFSGVKEKIEKQLLIKVNPMLRPFYGLAVSDMTIILDDLYVSEGTAIGVFFNVIQKLPFEASRLKNKNEILAASPAAKISEGTETYSGAEIRYTVSEDRAIASYESYIGSHCVVTNSLAFMKKIIDASASKSASLGAEIDFIYMRSLYKEKNPAGFLYFGDSAVRKMVSPSFKINERRRVNCMDNLDELNSSLAIYRCLYAPGTGEIEIPTLLKYGCLINEFVCPSGGNYEYDPADGSYLCTSHGRKNFMKPLSELDLKYVSENESKEYNQFVSRYHSYFRRFFDPIGIEIINTSDILSFRTYILPLIDNSEYNFLKTIAGGKPSKFEILDRMPAGTFFAFNFKINVFDGYKPDFSNVEDEELRKRAREGKKRHEDELDWNYAADIYSWIGPELAILVQDFGTEELDVRGMSRMEPPIAIVNNIKDKDTCLLFIFRSLKRHLGLYSDYDSYERSGVPAKKTRNPLKKLGNILREAASSMREIEYIISHSSQYKDYIIIEAPWFLRLNIGVSDKYAIVAPSRRVAEATIDNLEAGRTGEASLTKALEPSLKSHPDARNAFILFCPENVNKCVSFIVENNAREMRYNCRMRLNELNRAKFIRDRAAALPEGSRPDLAEAVCTSGEKYSSDASGFFYCPLHDNHFIPGEGFAYWYYSSTQAEMEASARALKLLFGLAKAVSASLSFTPEGIFTTFTIQKK